MQMLFVLLSFLKRPKTAKTQKLGHLYASSYFSGAFASSLAVKNNTDNPEEIFVAGLLYRLPWLALANTFPYKLKEMEKLIADKNVSNNKACNEVFGVEYDGICKALTNIYNLPDKVAKVLRNDDDGSDPLIALIRESGHISSPEPTIVPSRKKKLLGLNKLLYTSDMLLKIPKNNFSSTRFKLYLFNVDNVSPERANYVG